MKYLVRALTICLCGAVVAAQAPPQDPAQPTTFRSTVDLVPVDVNIIDETGKPIAGLEASDFVLKVDGKPRRVVSIQYIPSLREVGPVTPTPEHYSSNDRSSGGRMIMLVVDQGNIGSGRGRVVLESASRFVAQLSPADRVGLMTLPGAGPQIDFTEHHALVRTMLGKIVGQNSSFQTVHRIGMAEAAEIQRGNQLMLIEVTNRECSGMLGMELTICRRQISTDALTLYSLARERARNSMMALKHLMERLALTPSQKTIIYISEGLVVDRELNDVAWIAQAAARAQAVLYVLQLEAPMFDAEAPRLSPTFTDDRLMGEEGLGMLAGFTRGALMRVLGNGDSAFMRMSQELAGYYLLSFEPEPGDRDGRAHKIAVSVPGRKEASVRARSEFVIGDTRVRSAEEILTETMRAPLLSSEIPLKLSTYTLRDPVEDKLRVLFSADIDRSMNAGQKISLAYVLLDAKGAVISSQFVKNIAAAVQTGTRSQNFVASLPGGPAGMYTVKLAVVDEEGRRGSVEHTFRAQLSVAGQVRATDLLIGERGAAGEGVSPAVTGEVSGDMLHGYVELYADAEDVLKNTTVAIEVASDPEGRALDSTRARVLPSAENSNRRTAEGVVPIALLPAGDYVARAVISVGGRTTGQVNRPFTVSKTRVARVTSPLGKAPGSRPPIPFISRPEAFERSSVLSPEVVGFFMERMNFGPGGAAGAAAAVDHARAGRFEDAIAALSSAENQQLATLFLTGLSLYAKGQLEEARLKFGDSLRLNSEFFPAAFYLGSVYAAVGRDDQAVGAWQTSLVTESDAPFIYTLLADGFIRLGQVQSALSILNEAKSLWPDLDQVQLRLGTALALSGNAAESLDVLEPYLQRNPGDHDRQFVVLRALYEARQAGKTVRSEREDRELFDKHAAAYVAAGGPKAALLDAWRKAMKK
jgi:VWFA-related protein